MRPHRIVFGTVALLGLALPALGADEQTIELNQVPPDVKKAADKASPDAKWTKALKITAAGKTLYEVHGHNSKGRWTEVQLSDKGEVVEIETVIPVDEVHAPAVEALRAKYADVKPTKAKCIELNGKVTGYMMEAKLDGKPAEFYVSVDGKKVERSEAKE